MNPGDNPEMERIDTAIKSIWRLYRWDKWRWLEAIGLSKEVYKPLFEQFDMEYITSEHGMLHHPEQVMKFLQEIGPVLVDRAIFLIHMYWLIGGFE